MRVRPKSTQLWDRTHPSGYGSQGEHNNQNIAFHRKSKTQHEIQTVEETPPSLIVSTVVSESSTPAFFSGGADGLVSAAPRLFPIPDIVIEWRFPLLQLVFLKEREGTL